MDRIICRPHQTNLKSLSKYVCFPWGRDSDAGSEQHPQDSPRLCALSGKCVREGWLGPGCGGAACNTEQVSFCLSDGEPQQPSELRNDGTVSPAMPPGRSSNCPKLGDRSFHPKSHPISFFPLFPTVSSYSSIHSFDRYLLTIYHIAGML